MIEEILQTEDVGKKIEQLKQGRNAPLPDTKSLMDDWDPKRHEIIIDTEKYPKIEITVRPESTEYDSASGKVITIPAKTERVEPNRISVPVEQDIVNIHTSFTVGEEPKLNCTPDGEEKALLDAVIQVHKKNKLKFQNKKVVRSLFSEKEAAEYWYVAKDDGFWKKLWKQIKGKSGANLPAYKLKSTIWSPFRGDKLYPYYDESGDMIAFSREYKKTIKGKDVSCFMTLTDRMVYIWEKKDEWEERSFAHGFSKIPVLYVRRDESLCENVKPMRVRLEKLLSFYADCIDNHFFPMLKLFGDVENFSGKTRNRVVKLMGEGADAQYLTWQQASEPVRLELDTLTNNIYGMTNTPRITFENLKGTGNALSGASFRYVFMAAHMAVQNHAEELGPFFQRRVNFLVSALGDLNPRFKEPSETIDIEVEIQPYMIDSISDKVRTAVNAVSGGVWSRREGILFAGNIDRIDEELKEIESDKGTAGNAGAE